MKRLSYLLCAMCLPAVTRAAEQTGKVNLKTEPLSGANFAEMVLGLVAVIAAILFLAWIMRRLGRLPSMGGQHLQVIGSLNLGTRERVVLVQAGETQLLVGVAPGRVQALHVLDQPIELVHPNSTESGFAERLKAALNRKSES